MAELIQYIYNKFVHPLATFRALRLRADICRLMLHNHLSSSPLTNEASGVDVSLTTYGKRAYNIYLTIESIAMGAALPRRLILWLDDPGLYENLPRQLVGLQRRGLEIKLCDNYGPHTKYFPYVESQQAFNHQLVTADDDVIYPRYWLAGLIAAHQQFPGYVNCYRARELALRAGKIAPYREWPLCDSTVPGFRKVATGVSGVIYPSALLEVLKSAGTAFETCCPKADDLWLHVQAVRTGFNIRQMQSHAIHFPTVPGSQDTPLYAENLIKDGNDRQIAVTYNSTDLERFEEK